MGLVDRVKNICLTPNTEWPVIAGESGSAGKLMTDYVAPLAIIGPLAALVGGSVVGYSMPFVGTYRIPFLAGLSIAVFTFMMTFVSVFIMSLIIDALAPQFGGEKNPRQALKVAVYAYTPALAGGIFQILPTLIILAALAALYGLYLLYLGLPRLMKCPEDRAVSYTAVVAICAIVLAMIVSALANTFTGPGPMGAGMPGTLRDGRSGMQLDRKMEAAGGKMQDAQK